MCHKYSSMQLYKFLAYYLILPKLVTFIDLCYKVLLYYFNSILSCTFIHRDTWKYKALCKKVLWWCINLGGAYILVSYMSLSIKNNDET